MSVPLLPWIYHEARRSAGQSVNQTIKQPALFKSLTLRGLTLKNRIAVSPMCLYSARDGFINDFHVTHLGQFAIGGASLVIEEATAVQPNGRITPFDVGLWSDEHIDGQTRIVRMIHSQQCAAGIQLAHAGRKASNSPPFPDLSMAFKIEACEGGWPHNVVGPSAIAWNDGWHLPRELSIAEIHDIQQAFVAATKRCVQAGFDYVEIHAAHGFLFHSFYSSHSNNRTDEYGGSFENRVRFLVETTKLVRESLPAEKPLAVRLSCTDWIESEDGWDIEQTIKLVELLIAAGVDVIDTSSGGNAVTQKLSTDANEIKSNYQTELGARVKLEFTDKVLVGPVGRIQDGVTANDLIESGKADFVHIGREFLRDPHFVFRAAKDLNHTIWRCPQYEWSIGTAYSYLHDRQQTSPSINRSISINSKQSQHEND